MNIMSQGCGGGGSKAGSKRSRQTEAPNLESWLELMESRRAKPGVRRHQIKKNKGYLARAIRTKPANTRLQ